MEEGLSTILPEVPFGAVWRDKTAKKCHFREVGFTAYIEPNSIFLNGKKLIERIFEAIFK